MENGERSRRVMSPRAACRLDTLRQLRRPLVAAALADRHYYRVSVTVTSRTGGAASRRELRYLHRSPTLRPRAVRSYVF
jgi:hypothetical protein